MLSKESYKRSLKPAVKDTHVLSSSIGNVAKGTAVILEPKSRNLVSPTGSSTSSLDSPLDTTDNEVYKTVIPKPDTSRRENSLAVMLNRAIEIETCAVVETKQPEAGAEISE